MCDGFSEIALASIAVGSAAMSGVSAATQANASKQSANYQAQVDQNNATIATQQRSAAIDQGQTQSMQAELQQSQLLSQQKADLTANGLNLNSGSAVDLLASTKFLGQQDVNAIQTNAARQAWGYSVQASNDQAQSSLAKWQADNTNPAAIGAMAGAGSLLSSASSYAMSRKGLIK